MISLDVEYQDNASRYERLRGAIVEQVSNLLLQAELTLGVPIESRVKTLISIKEKLERKAISLATVSELQDLVGVRVIFLFKKDLATAVELLKDNFVVESLEDTSARLGDAEFGYQSQHLILKVPSSWTSVPSFSNLGDLFVEVQVRTLAQHIWAAVSHKLQYKSEGAVPPPIRRAINRASALLETVDLEFDRVLAERDTYIAQEVKASDDSSPLNVDSLAAVLGKYFPESNKAELEPYAELLDDLKKLKVNTLADLELLLSKWMELINTSEAKRVEEQQSSATRAGREPSERVNRGVFFTHVGLARTALRAEFGDNVYDQLWRERKKQTRKPPPKNKE